MKSFLIFTTNAVHFLVGLYSITLLMRVWLEMIYGPYHKVVIFLWRLTEPVLAPIRRRIPPIRSGNVAWDISVIVAVILLWIVEQILVMILSALWQGSSL